MIPNAIGITEVTAYAVAKNQDEAKKKACKYMSGNYDVGSIEMVGELYDFGTDFYVPEEF